MSFNANIIDSQLDKLKDELAAELEERLNIKNDQIKLRSTCFVYLVVKLLLDLSDEEALETLTEGGGGGFWDRCLTYR